MKSERLEIETSECKSTKAGGETSCILWSEKYSSNNSELFS
jgi:hypothetical protein